MASSPGCASFGMTRKVASLFKLNGRSLRRCTPPVESSTTVLSDRGFCNVVQGISAPTSRLSCGNAIVLLTQWPNDSPRALLLIQRAKNSLSRPARVRPGPLCWVMVDCSWVVVEDFCPGDLILVFLLAQASQSSGSVARICPSGD